MKAEAGYKGDLWRKSVEETLATLIIAAPEGLGNSEDAIIQFGRSVRSRFRFFELIVILPLARGTGDIILSRLGELASQTRVLFVDRQLGFDDLIVHGLQESIGDVIVVATIEELSIIDPDSLIDPIIKGSRLVRLRRPQNTYLGWLGSRFVRVVTGFRVDTRFCRTLALNRQLLSELLVTPGNLILFRFLTGKYVPGYTVVVLDRPHLPRNLRSQLKRVDLAARLLMTAAPRLLRYAAVVCALLSLLALLALLYVAGVWFFKKSVVEGWTSLTALIGLWMSVQLAATSIICLGLSRQLNRNADNGRIISEIGVGDLFSNSAALNVDLNTSSRDWTSQNHQTASKSV